VSRANNVYTINKGRIIQIVGRYSIRGVYMRRIRLRHELLLLDLLVILIIVVLWLFPTFYLRVVLGLPLLLFFPGYALMAAIFTRREEGRAFERVSLSFGLSIVIVPLICLILHFTPWGLKVESILYATFSFILISSAAGWFRRRRLPDQERAGIEFQWRAPAFIGNAWQRSLSVILLAAILAALGTAGYVAAKPKVGERFTEFYVLGLSGKAAGYPGEIRTGEAGEVLLGIANHEKGLVSYRIEVKVAGIRNNEVAPIILADEQMWEEVVSFLPDRAGDRQKVEFLLYKDDEAEPCLKPLQLWVDVK
jgi:uncharacterized membrane protein